jgi:hypothetical protein
MTYQKIILVLVILELCATIAIKIYFAKKGEKISDSKGYKNVYVNQTHEHVTPKLSPLVKIETLVITVVLFWQIMTNNYYDVADRYKISKLYLSYQPISVSNYENPIVVGKPAPDLDVQVRIFDKVIDEVNFSKHKSWSSIGGINYYYYMILIDSLY